MSPEMIQRMKSFGINTPAEMKERMKQFRRGGGQRGGGQGGGGQRRGGGSTTSGQPTNK